MTSPSLAIVTAMFDFVWGTHLLLNDRLLSAVCGALLIVVGFVLLYWTIALWRARGRR